MEVKAFFRATLNYSIGIFGSKVIMFALVPFYSFFLTREDLGEYDLILVSITLFTPLITLQVSDAVYRNLLETTKNSERRAFISSGLLVIGKGYILFGAVALVLNLLLGYSFFPDFMALLLTSCLYVFSQQTLRGLQKNRMYAGMGIANALLVAGFSLWFLLVLDWGLQGILWSLVFAQGLAVILALFWAKLWKQIAIKAVSTKVQRALLAYSWPLLPNAISWWLIDLGNRYIILFFLGEEYNGIYAVAARFAGIMALINSIFILAWQDHAITDGSDNRVDLIKASRVLRYFIVFELTTILLLSAAARPIIQWTTDPSFHAASKYFPILLMASGFSAFSAYFGAFYLKEKQTFKLFTTSIFGGFCNMIFSVLLVGQIGLFAVAMGSLLGFVATFLSRLRDYRVQVPKRNVVALLLLFSATLFIQFMGSEPYVWLNIIFAVIIFVLLNKGLFLSLKEKAFPS